MCREPGPGELQKFVDALIARSVGVQCEVERIPRVQKHRKYIKEKAARDGLVHGKRRMLRSPTKEETAARVETKRLKAIDMYGACETCGRWHVAAGDSPSSQRAGLAHQCRRCYDGGDERKKDPHAAAGAAFTSKLIRENGLCPKCEAHAIAGGVSEVSVLARDAGLCIYCYRDTRTRSHGPRTKICQRCVIAPVAPGPSLLAVVARRKGLCLKCHRDSWKE